MLVFMLYISSICTLHRALLRGMMISGSLRTRGIMTPGRVCKRGIMTPGRVCKRGIITPGRVCKRRSEDGFEFVEDCWY